MVPTTDCRATVIVDHSMSIFMQLSLSETANACIESGILGQMCLRRKLVLTERASEMIASFLKPFSRFISWNHHRQIILWELIVTMDGLYAISSLWQPESKEL